MLATELADFIAPEIRTKLMVENANPTERINVRLKINFPRMKCEHLGIDIQDDVHKIGIVANIVKTPFGPGNKSCRFESSFHIHKVPGKFRVSTHSASALDFSHIISELSFGSQVRKINSKGIGSYNTLGDRGNTRPSNGLESYDYAIRLVPTTYQDVNGREIMTAYQYTYAFHSFTSSNGVPALWFQYDPVSYTHLPLPTNREV